MKTSALIIFTLIFSSVTFADGENTHYSKVSSQPLKIESRTTEPTPLPEPEETVDPIDQPPVLQYAQPHVAAPVVRMPANLAPSRYVDTDFGVACYYIIPPTVPGVVTPAAPAISCVKLVDPKAPVTAPPARTN